MRRNASSSFPSSLPRSQDGLGHSNALSKESLHDRVGRAKARWLNRIMYCASISPNQKCMAYAIADHLNCVTLDCWPSQQRLAGLLGNKCVKTVQRAAHALVRSGVLSVKHVGRGSCRYSPIFVEGDWGNGVQTPRQERPATADKNVRQSFSDNLTQEPWAMHNATPKYDVRQRGFWEMKLADKLGSNGFQLLHQLSAHDDQAVDRLCAALASGCLGPREIAAARLAIGQYR
jgi:hypothetical protein